MPIKAMNTFTKDWVIKARVSMKGELRTTRNGGYLLKIELVDSFGTPIEGTFFNDAAQQFNGCIEQNKVYLFSNANVKMANKKFTSVKNDFCIIFEKHAQIQEVKDDGSINEQAFEFVKIATIEESVQLKSADVLGVVTETSDMEEIKLKSGQSKSRKHITITDQSMCSINLTLWGDGLCSKQMDLKVGQVLSIKAARISDFGGKCLNASDDQSQLFTDLPTPESQKLKEWYRSH